MIAADAVAVILLAAGLSRRFDSRDKLAEPLDGRPMGLHAARMLGSLQFAARIAVTRDGGAEFAAYGFTCIVNPDPGAGQSLSIRLGLLEARRVEPKAVLIALADMPFVSAAHIETLLLRFDKERAIIASTAGAHPSAPAIFGRSMFSALEALEGDRGARVLLNSASLVTASSAELADIDTPADLPPAPNRRLP